eukprot:15332113-Ditylum_brightwellii.AAC.1
MKHLEKELEEAHCVNRQVSDVSVANMEHSDANKADNLNDPRTEYEDTRKSIERNLSLIEFNETEIKGKEKQVLHLKRIEKKRETTKRAKELERKRRMLKEGEILLEDEEEAITLEDICITLIQ